MKTLPAPAVPGYKLASSRLVAWCRRHDRLTALLAFTLLGVIFVWPLFFHINEAVIGQDAEGDPVYYSWYLWWYKQALETGQDPFHTHNIFALLPTVQVFAQSYLDSLLSVPLQWVFSPLGANNILTFLSIPFSGFTTYLLAGEFTKNRLAQFVAGFFFVFSTYHLVRMGGSVTLSTLQFVPFCAWRVFVFYRRPTFWSAVLAGLSVGLVPLSEIYFLGYFLLPFGFLFLVGKLLSDYRWFLKPRHLGLGAVALATALLIMVPVLLPFLRIDPEVQAEAMRVSDITTEMISANLVAYFLPYPANPIFGGLTAPVYATFEYSWEKTVYLGYVLIGLATAAFFFKNNRHRATYFWLVVALVSIGLSFGPKLYIVDNPVINWPFYNLVFDYPLFSTFRAPSRTSFLTVLALAIIAAMAVTSLYAKFVRDRRSRFVFYGITAVLLVASLAENLAWSFPYPSKEMVVPGVYNLIAADPQPGLVLELPDLLPSTGAYMFYQTVHHKPIVNGYPPRTTESMIRSVENLPYMSAFMYPQLAGNPAAYRQDIYPYNTEFKAALQEKGITYVVLHPHAAFTNQDYATMQSFLRQQLGPPVYDNPAEKVIGWYVAPVPVAPSNANRFTRGTGWLLQRLNFDGNNLERYVSQDGQLLIDAPAAGPQTLSLVARPFYKPLTLELRLNGKVVETVNLAQPGQSQALSFKPLVFEKGRNVLEIHSVEGCQPRYLYVEDSRDPDCYAFGIQQVRLGS